MLQWKTKMKWKEVTFMTSLERTYVHSSSYDIKIIIGDFNAKGGNERSGKTVVESHSLHDKSSDNGVRLINFAV
jgi:hypothetical protein